MLCVTGAARTGTSAMMQTLKILGVDVACPKFLPAHENILEHNPKGFYEFNGEVKDGVQSDIYKGKAVKMFGYQLSLTPKEFIDKVIVCRRFKADAVKSYLPILKTWYGEEKCNPDYYYESHYLDIGKYVVDIPHIYVNFEAMKSNPKYVIERIIEFLGIEVSEEQKELAIKNVD